MQIKEERDLTQCSVTFHLRESFVRGLPKPSGEQLKGFRERYELSQLAVDHDNLIGRYGRFQTEYGRGLIQELGLIYDRHRAMASCLFLRTEDAFVVVEDLMRSVYDVCPDALREALSRITYVTTTKAKFSGMLRPLFSPGMQRLFAKWDDVDSGSVVAPMKAAEWPPASRAMVHAAPDYWQDFFGEGAPKKGVVVPYSLRFQVNLVPRFHKVLSHEVQLSVENAEDCLENKYLVTSELAQRVNLHLALGGSFQQPLPLQASAVSK